MRSVALHLHCRTDGSYQLVLTSWEDGEGVRLLQSEESRPLPGVAPSEAFSVAAQMATETLRALEPSPGLWAAAGAFRTS